MTFLYKLLIAIPVAYTLDILFGVANSKIKHTFDKEVFKTGVLKGVLIYISIGLFIFLAWLLPELSVNLNGVEFTLFNGIVSVLWTVVYIKVGSAFMKFIQLWNLKQDQIRSIDHGVIEIEHFDEIEGIG